MKRIGLIQIDGEMPNLALMKISAYHKSKGDKVYLMIDKTISVRLIEFDKVYISCIFEENKDKAIQIKKQFKNAELGGVGVNDYKLPKEIECQMPDYDLYGIDYSMGFATRGCIRKCEFCKVPKIEGMIRKNDSIYQFWNRKHKHIVLMDNNILAMPKVFEEVAQDLIREGLTVDFNQGLDIRLFNDKNAEILSKLNVRPYCRFAFDSMKYEREVLRGIKLLNKYNIKGSMFYVLVGFDTTIEQDLYRLNLLKKLDQRAYVMRYKTCRGKKEYNDLASWSYQIQFFKSMDFDTFLKCRYDRTQIITKTKIDKTQHNMNEFIVSKK